MKEKIKEYIEDMTTYIFMGSVAWSRLCSGVLGSDSAVFGALNRYLEEEADG